MATGHRYDFRQVGIDMIIEMVIKTNGGSQSHQGVFPVHSMIRYDRARPAMSWQVSYKEIAERKRHWRGLFPTVDNCQQTRVPFHCFENHLLHNKCNTSNNMCWIQQYRVAIQMWYAVCDWVNIQIRRIGEHESIRRMWWH